MSPKSSNQDSPSLLTRLKGSFLLLIALAAFLGLISCGFTPYATHPLGYASLLLGWALISSLGFGAFPLTAYIGWVGWQQLRGRTIEHRLCKHLLALLFVFSFCLLLSQIEVQFPRFSSFFKMLFFPRFSLPSFFFHLGGMPLYYLYDGIPFLNLHYFVGGFGITLFGTLLFLISSYFLFNLSLLSIYRTLRAYFQKAAPEPAVESASQPKKKVKSRKEEAIMAQMVYNGDFANYKLPPITLLTEAKRTDQSALKKDLRRQADVLTTTLSSFGIEAKVGQINCGPTITSFEVHPAVGVKVQKIKTLENDLALNMQAKTIRILAPIPGKAAIGIEVPNPISQEVSFKELLQAYTEGGKPLHIPLFLGKTVTGGHVLEDLSRMPHFLIAGATGSGKSVCINTIVMSILMTARPDEIRLLLVDPKKVELTPYTQLPHMLAPVITEPLEATKALNWLVKEMERRYSLLKAVGLRNITAFNHRKINADFESSLEMEVPRHLHYIVCIIDEFADLMMLATNDIETSIARIAQMARAVGIHLILATQRPSREVITGLIKANFPARIAFKVSSRVNSLIILDEIGAESLLGNGDLLFLPPGTSQISRAQGAYIRDEDIRAVVDFICAQAPTNYISSFETEEELDAALAEKSSDLFSRALDLVQTNGNASTTFLQRKLKIGYPTAASLMDELESKGVIGPSNGSKPRTLLFKDGKKE